MRKTLTIIGALIAAMAIVYAPGTSSAQASSSGACRGPDYMADDRILFFTNIVTRTDAENTRIREALLLLRVTTTPAVVLVSDDSVCAQVAAAVDSFLNDGRTTASLWVLSAGPDRYIAFDGSQDQGWPVHWVFDKDLNYLSTAQGYM